MIRVAELFAGVGGFRVGLERAGGYQVVFSNQWEPSTKKQWASEVYEARFGSDGHTNIDVNDVEVDKMPDFDLLVGGFPCQDYSVASTSQNSKGLIGKKGVLWWSIHKILRDKATKPKYILLENVDRILKSPTSQRGRDFAVILKSLEELGYAVEWRVINAADYGMPQRRKRVFIMGFLKGTDIYEEIEKSQSKWLLESGISAKSFPATKDEVPFTSFKIEGDIPTDKPSRTIITGEGGKSASRFKHVIKTGDSHRRLTPVELERLNMFPDNHTYIEGITPTKRAFFMGNALVVGIVEKLGTELFERTKKLTPEHTSI